MKITEQLAGVDCSNGVTCDGIVATDGEDVVVRGRYLTADQATSLGLPCAGHEGLVLINRSLVDELRAR